MTIRDSFFVILSLFFIFTPAAADPVSKAEDPRYRAIELWPDSAPGATGSSDEDKPAIIPFLPAGEKNTGTAVLILPGGGFMTRATDHEGVLIAQWFKERGIAGFILRYRIRPIYTRKESIMDAQRGLQYLRAHAAEFKIAPNRIGVIGFSAGADLATDIAYRTVDGRQDMTDPVERVSSRPDFLILAYGAARIPTEERSGTLPLPPTFMFCTAEDASHLVPMIELYGALRRDKVPVEAHFFVSGEHGVGFAQGDPVLGEWPGLMFKWMLSGGLMTVESRVAVKGVVKIDGEPLSRGAVILTPIDRQGAPPAVAYVFNTGPVLGQFAINQNQGLVPGRYRVEVRQDSTRWMSNSRNPMMVRMNQKMRNGTLTDEDRKEWNEYARRRDLSPSIDQQRVFRRIRPGDKTDLIVEIKSADGGELNIEIFSR